MMSSEEVEEDYVVRFREDEEMEFFMELALHETERWIQAVTKKSLPYPDDMRKSLENGVLLCELLNCLRPGTIKRINKLSTPLAGMDNLNVFLQACRNQFGLVDTQLFSPSDLEDLSQRAIAESGQLKDEYDKRLRNVIVTIYWLGKVTAKQGPLLDFSAFSALIHQKHTNPESVQSATTADSSKLQQWDWPHGTLNVSESSFDSYEKESCESLDEPDMPMTRYSSASALNRQSLQAFNSSYSEERNNSTYKSTPDLSHAGSSHRRYSSTDSLDDSHTSGAHSRQSSDSQEVGYPTRRKSSQTSRKPSASTDPLQFVKLRGAKDLAHTAEVQMRIAAESKQGAALTRASDEDADWQSNLSTWKNRRKSQSEKSYLLQQEQEESYVAPKTYTQMKEDREKRKSFYPTDEGEDDAFTSEAVPSLTSAVTKASPAYSVGDGVADWAKEDGDKSSSKTDDQNNNSALTLPSSRSKLSQKLQAFDDDDNDTSFSKVSTSSLNKYQRFPEKLGKSSADKSKSRTQPLEAQTASVIRDNYVSRESSSSTRNKFQDSWNKRDSETHITTTGNVGSRTQSKIGSIMKTLTESENKTAQPKHGYNEKIDFSDRRSAFLRETQEPYSEPDRNLGLQRQEPHRHESSDEEEGNESYGSDQREKHQMPDSAAAILTSNLSTNSNSQPTHSNSQPTHSNSQPTHSNSNKLNKAIDKTIVISQHANNERGFGFFLTGGADLGLPITVSKVTLGSGADLSELRLKDVILSVNNVDVTCMSATQVGDLVAKAVTLGHIQLKIRREQNFEEEEEDDEFSSEDESLESHSPTFASTSRAQAPPVPPPMLSPMKMEPQTRLSVTVDRSLDSIDGAMSTSSSKPSPSSAPMADDDSDGSGPPAILRKWQRQRHKEEYTFDTYDSNPETFKRISLNASLTHLELDLQARDEEFANKQVQGYSANIEENAKSVAESSDVPNQTILTMDEIYSRQEENASQWSADNARLLEERRAERRARIQQSAADMVAEKTSKAFTPSNTDTKYTPSNTDTKYTPSTTDTKYTPSNTDTKYTPSNTDTKYTPSNTDTKYTPSNTDTKYTPSNTDTKYTPSQSPGPHTSTGPHTQSPRPFVRSRDQPPEGQPVNYLGETGNNAAPLKDFAPVQFQLTEPSTEALLQAERERIREEEMKKLEEERKRLEKEQREREEAKLRELREREEQVKLEKEKLERERAIFLREQAEFKRLQQQLHQPVPHPRPDGRDHTPNGRVEHQQQEAKVLSKAAPQTDSSANRRSQHFSRDEMLAMNRTATPLHTLPTEYNGGSPVERRSPVIREAPSRLEIHSLNSVPKAKLRDSAQWFSSANLSSGTHNISGSSHNLSSSQHLSTSSQNLSTSSQNLSTSSYVPRSSQAGQRKDKKAASSGKMFSMSGDHWLIEEAERRRLADSAKPDRSSRAISPQFSGPIKPTNENRWRDNPPTQSSMPKAIRQTLLEKTANVRGSDLSANVWGSDLSHGTHTSSHSQPEHNFHKASHHQQPTQHHQQLTQHHQQPSQHHQQPTQHHQQPSQHHHLQQYDQVLQQQGFYPQQDKRPVPAHPPPPPADGGVAVSGLQHCSHCSQEIGYGTAMGIEALNLYYHIQCFRCSVCHASLGSGTHGADVRVKANKLHCPNCYSNDEAGLKYSQV